MPAEATPPPLSTHPLLFEERPQAQGEGEATPPEATPAAASPPPAQPPAPPQPATTPPPPGPLGAPGDVVALRQASMAQDVSRLWENNPEFRQAAATQAGRGRAAERDARIEAADARANAAEKVARRYEIAAMSEQEIDAEFQANPQFALNYAEMMHEDDSAAVRQAEQITAEAEYYSGQRTQLFTDASAAGVAPDRLQAFEQGFSTCPMPQHRGMPPHGFFDHDANGNMFDQVYSDPAQARRASHDRFAIVIAAEIGKANAENAQNERARLAQVTPPPTGAVPPQPATAVPPPAAAPVDENLALANAVSAAQAPPAQVAPAAAAVPPPAVGIGEPNQALTQDPDMSAPGRTAGTEGGYKYTMDQVRQMTPPKRLELWPNEGDWQRAIENGEVFVPGLSEELRAQDGLR